MDPFLKTLSEVKHIDGLAVAKCWHKSDVDCANHSYAATKTLVPMVPRNPVRNIVILGDKASVAEFAAAAEDFKDGVAAFPLI